MAMSPSAVMSASPSKKRKHTDNASLPEGASRKKVKKEKKEKSKKRDKGKAKDVDSSEFKLVNASLVVSIPPVFANDPMSGVEEMLDSLVMRHIPALSGVLICHTNTRFLSQTATIKNECPFAICTVAFDATVWSPQVGAKLIGTVNLCSPDHISLLVHKTFNVSIPRHHIPTDTWEFDYSFGKEEPELEVAPNESSNAEPNAMDIDDNGMTENEEAGARGSWVHRITAEPIGGKGGTLEFTVIGFTVANQMLSLVGSLQPDPFSSEHTPTVTTLTTQKAPSQTQQSVAPQRRLPELPAEPEGSDIDDDDPFGDLGRLGDAAAAKELAEKQQVEIVSKAEKKKSKNKKDEKGEQAQAIVAATKTETLKSEPGHKKKKKKKASED